MDDSNTGSKEATTNAIAAEEVSKADARPFVVTPYDQVRRQYQPTSLTESIARQMVDASQAFAGMNGELTDLVAQIDPATYRAIRQRALSDQGGGGE